MNQRMRVAKHSFFNQAILGLYLPLAGGTMDLGAIINMNGGDITFIDNITFAAGNLDMTATATNRIILPISNLPATPSLTLDGGNSGIYSAALNTLRVAIGGVNIYRIDTNNIRSAINNGPTMISAAMTATVPGFTPNTDPDTGQSWPGADILGGTAGGVLGWHLREDANVLEFRTYGSIVRKVTDVNATPYTVLQTDYYLQCRRTAAGILTVNLPSIATVSTATSAFILYIKDTGINAAVNNITVARNGADTINGVAANYTINVDNTCVKLSGNDTTSDWEIC